MIADERVADEHRPTPDIVAAVLGGVERPTVMLSQLVEMVENLSETENSYKNATQMRLWRNPRKRAVANLMKARRERGLDPDKPVLDINHQDALIHRRYWKKKIAGKGLDVDTANKDFANMAGMLKRYYESLEDRDEDPNAEPPPRPYAGISLTDRHKEVKRKPEFSTKWIEEKILAPGALDDLNDEAADITIIEAETGCRQSEIYNLPPGDIHLDHPIPHFLVRNVEPDDDGGTEGREIKNKHSKRPVPLGGISLAAMRRHPVGFPRYRGTVGPSALVNDYFRKHGLFPSPEHTIGGLRHSPGVSNEGSDCTLMIGAR